MKRNIIYMVGALLSSAILTFSCSEDNVPSYNDVSVDKTDLLIKIENPNAEVNIINGNGNYKISIADENIATAKIDGNKIFFTGLKNGKTTVTVTDWTKHSSIINVRVKEDFELTLEKNELTLIKDVKATELISIISGNGEYKIENSNEAVATATLVENNKIEITAISYGHAIITVTDDNDLEQTIEVAIYEHLFEIGDLPTDSWYPSETKEIPIIKLGNGAYEVVEGYDTEIVANVEIEENIIKITGNTKTGETTVTIKDQMGLSVEIPVKVESKLIVEKTVLDWMVVDTPTEVKILFGSGNYSLSTSDNSITCTLSDDNIITVIGTSQKALQTITVTDNDWNVTATIKVLIIDTRLFLDYAARWYVQGAFQEGIPHSTISTDSGREHIKVATGKTWTGALKNGFHISFEGGRTEGKKTSLSQLVKINNSGGESNICAISDLEIVKREYTKPEDEADGKGKFWIRFKEEGREEYSYIITWF